MQLPNLMKEESNHMCHVTYRTKCCQFLLQVVGLLYIHMRPLACGGGGGAGGDGGGGGGGGGGIAVPPKMLPTVDSGICFISSRNVLGVGFVSRVRSAFIDLSLWYTFCAHRSRFLTNRNSAMKCCGTRLTMSSHETISFLSFGTAIIPLTSMILWLGNASLYNPIKSISDLCISL